MLADQADGSGWQPSYVERRKDSWRGYFAWMPAGTHAVEYVVRLNGSGRFTLPPTRVEAMYSPAIRGQWPNGTMTVAASAECMGMGNAHVLTGRIRSPSVCAALVEAPSFFSTSQRKNRP